MSADHFQHPERFPKNAPGAFYTLGDQRKDGTWCGRCLACEVPEHEAPTLLAPLTDANSDTYFLRQPKTDEEIEQACCALELCCVDALRYGGKDPKILARLRRTDVCDYELEDVAFDTAEQAANEPSPSDRRWWEFWK